MLTLKWTRVSPTHHRLQYIREDGSGESAEIDTKSFLMHDLLHFALETEAVRSEGFFGLLNKGHTYAELNNKEPADFARNDAMKIEQAVGALTGIIKSGARASDTIAVLRNMYDAYGEPMPNWLTADMLDRSATRFQALWGHWNSLKFGETLELQFKI